MCGSPTNQELSVKRSGGFGDHIGAVSNLAKPQRHRCRNKGVHRPSMALIVFRRGINVGGHRTFRPSMLARDVAAYDVVNVGAAGALVFRNLARAASSLLNCAGSCRLKRKWHSATPVILSDWKWRIRLEVTITPGCCSIREHPVESRPGQGFPADRISRR